MFFICICHNHCLCLCLWTLEYVVSSRLMGVYWSFGWVKWCQVGREARSRPEGPLTSFFLYRIPGLILNQLLAFMPLGPDNNPGWSEVCVHSEEYDVTMLPSGAARCITHCTLCYHSGRGSFAVNAFLCMTLPARHWPQCIAVHLKCNWEGSQSEEAGGCSEAPQGEKP